jgi:hypothetical protein
VKTGGVPPGYKLKATLNEQWLMVMQKRQNKQKWARKIAAGCDSKFYYFIRSNENKFYFYFKLALTLV